MIVVLTGNNGDSIRYLNTILSPFSRQQTPSPVALDRPVKPAAVWFVPPSWFETRACGTLLTTNGNKSVHERPRSP